MTKKIEYDFLTWKSFPSSARLFNDEQEGFAIWILPQARSLPVTPGSTLRVEANVKQKDVAVGPYPSLIPIDGWNGKEWSRIVTHHIKLGTFDWLFLTFESKVPSGIITITPALFGGAGYKEAPAITWFDDLKIYQDDKLIYANDFSNWTPIIIPAQIITGAAMIKFIK